MKSLLWLLGVIFWPLLAIILAFLSFGFGTERRDFPASCTGGEEVALLLIGGIGFFLFYVGYVADIIGAQMIYLMMVNCWAVAVPLPKDLLELEE